jgi:hypothetical protein
MKVPEPLSADATEEEKTAYNTQMQEINDALMRDIQFCYRINDYYVPSFSNNTISCKVVTDEKVYETEKVFTFASYGTSGTDYTLVVTPVGRQAAVTSKKALKVKIMLFNHDNEMIAISTPVEIRCNYGVASWASEDPTLVEENTCEYIIPASDNPY